MHVAQLLILPYASPSISLTSESRSTQRGEDGFDSTSHTAKQNIFKLPPSPSEDLISKSRQPKSLKESNTTSKKTTTSNTTNSDGEEEWYVESVPNPIPKLHPQTLNVACEADATPKQALNNSTKTIVVDKVQPGDKKDGEEYVSTVNTVPNTEEGVSPKYNKGQ
eukprot:11543846-Ditylum_brightwellii.AAC.1